MCLKSPHGPKNRLLEIGRTVASFWCFQALLGTSFSLRGLSEVHRHCLSPLRASRRAPGSFVCLKRSPHRPKNRSLEIGRTVARFWCSQASLGASFSLRRLSEVNRHCLSLLRPSIRAPGPFMCLKCHLKGRKNGRWKLGAL